MAAAALTETTTNHTDEFRRGRPAVRPETLPPLRRLPLPAGRPRAW